MSAVDAEQARQLLAQVYQSESRRVFATLVRLLNDFDLAEEAMLDAFASAAEQWPRDGVPANPRAWLVSAGRFKAIDTVRRRSRFDASLHDIARRLDQESTPQNDAEDIEDDRLRLIFTCCHPALAPAAQLALTLREVCGLKTEEIAAAFLTSPSTIAQRIVRGKVKIRDTNIPYQVPSVADLPERVGGGDGAEGDLPGVQRGLFRLVGPVAHAARPFARGNSAGASAEPVARRLGGAGAARLDAVAGVAACRADLSGRGHRAA
jgi:RNA polymerase sigma-70 factor (ECF subfamily)